jgi:rhodanese-related sulfurtransferase
MKGLLKILAQMIGIGLLAAAFVTLVLPYKASAAGLDNLPEAKRTRAALYVEAKDVPAFIERSGGPARVLFLDLRTRAEAMYVEPMQDFVPEVNRRLNDKGLSKTDIVVLICRSGDRSSRGANRLADDGFSRVYSVVDGFEGDMTAEGRRAVNGWKNAGLPWSYRLDKARMYFPR